MCNEIQPQKVVASCIPWLYIVASTQLSSLQSALAYPEEADSSLLGDKTWFHIDISHWARCMNRQIAGIDFSSKNKSHLRQIAECQWVWLFVKFRSSFRKPPSRFCWHCVRFGMLYFSTPAFAQIESTELKYGKPASEN